MRIVGFKRTYLCFLIFLLFAPALFAGGDGYYEFSWDEIKQVKGNATECTISSDSEDNYFSEATAIFNAKGKLTEYDQDYMETEFTYNNWGLAEIKSGGYDENYDFTTWGKTIYSYDAKGKLNKISYSYGDDEEEYMSEEGITYDKNGNIKIERLTPEGSVYMLETLNKDFYPIELITYTTDSVAMGLPKKDIESKTTFKYDKDYNLIEKAIEYTTLPFEGALKKVVQSFKYEFDKNGNKISQKTTLTPKEAISMFPEMARPLIHFAYTYPGADKAAVSPPPTEQNVLVEYSGTWYPAVILKQDGKKYLIHYTDYDSSWDEWVTIERLKYE